MGLRFSFRVILSNLKQEVLDFFIILQAFVAARDINAGEQLCISYIDQTASLPARQQQLYFSYGFKCNCALCVEQAAE